MPDTMKSTLKKADKVAICGFATSTRDLAPFDDPSFEIWGCNALGKKMAGKRFDRMFDPHRYEGDHPTIRFEHRHKWYREWGGPVYMIQPDPTIPNSLAYPIDEVYRHFFVDVPKGRRSPWFGSGKSTKNPYFTSTIAYMIALAIYEGFREVHVYGVDMTADSEYLHQKACVEAWLMLASGMGIEIYVPARSALLSHSYMYAYEDEPGVGFVDEDQIGSLRADAERNQREKLAEAHAYEGVVQFAEQLVAIIENPDDERQIDADLLRAVVQDKSRVIAEARSTADVYSGVIQTCDHFSRTISARKRGLASPDARVDVLGAPSRATGAKEEEEEAA